MSHDLSPRLAGPLVIAQSLLIFIPLVVLGAAIEWPASLDDPAEVALPRLLENEGTVRFGYLVYLAFSVLFLPAATFITHWISRGRTDTALVRIAVGMATASAALRCIGIVRWLSTMFPMAERWEAADTSTRAVLALQFEATNDYGGAIGEALGVSLFAVGWLVATVLAGGGAGRTAPRWLLVGGLAAAAVLASSLVSLTGVDPGALLTTAGGTAIGVWMLLSGILILRSPATGGAARTGSAV